MEYNKLISVTGFSGLFELITSKTDGAIVRSLEDNSTKFVSSRIHQFSHLESIEVYTTDENINLADLFKKMDASQTPIPSEKDNKAVLEYFKTITPELDFERVYTSDMKKMVRWFSIIQKNQIELILSEIEEDEIDEEEAN